MPHQKNIACPSVFTTQEFLTLADIPILKGASDTDLKNSLNLTAGAGNNHYSDDESEQPASNNTNAAVVSNNIQKGSCAITMKEELLDINVNEAATTANASQKLTIVELEKISFTNENKRPVEDSALMSNGIVKANEGNVTNMPKKKKLKKSGNNNNNDNNNTLKQGSNKSGLNINQILGQSAKNNNNPAIRQVIMECKTTDMIVDPKPIVNGDKCEAVVAVAKQPMQMVTPAVVANDNEVVVVVEQTLGITPTLTQIYPAAATAANVTIDKLQLNQDPTSSATKLVVENNTNGQQQQDDEIVKIVTINNDSKSDAKTTGMKSKGKDIEMMKPGVNNSKPESSSKKTLTDELKELIQREKQNTADLFMQLLKCQEDSQQQQQLQTQNGIQNPNHQQPNYMHQNSNSSDISITELTNIHNSLTNGNQQTTNLILQQQQQQQRLKSATPTVSSVDQLLISPLFNQFLPSCGSTSSNSSNSSNSCSSTGANSSINSNMLTFSQFAAAAAVAAANNNNNNTNKTRKTPISFHNANLIGNESNGTAPNTKITHASRSSFKRTKNDNSKGELYLNVLESIVYFD